MLLFYLTKHHHHREELAPGPGSFNARVVFELVSYTELDDYIEEFNYTYCGIGGRGFEKFIRTFDLKKDRYVDFDVEITLTLIAKITI
jgi:hypothetical protein